MMGRITFGLFMVSAILSLNLAVMAQDIHFSQFDAAPLNLNPATTGMNDANYRIANNYKSQWSSVGVPYSTMFLGADVNILSQKWQNGRYLGIGTYAYRDVAGKSNFSTANYSMSLSTGQKLSGSHYLSAGLGGGFVQQSVNLQDLSWDSQFSSGTYDPSLPTGESFLYQQNSYFDVSGGICWQMRKNDDIKTTAGLAIFHANQPENSLAESGTSRLARKYVFHGTSTIKLNSSDSKPEMFILPKLLVVQQGPHREIFVGSYYRYLVQGASRYTNFRNRVTIDFGGFYRLGDSFVAAFNVDYGKIKFGVSYDANTSPLRKASSYRGGVEFAIVYTGLYSSNLIKIK